MNNLISILKLVGLLLIDGIFVSAEYAVLATSKIQIADLAQQGDPTAKLMHATLNNANKQNRYISTSQICISVISLALGMVGEGIFSNWLAHSFCTILICKRSCAHHCHHLGHHPSHHRPSRPWRNDSQNAHHSKWQSQFLRILIRPMNLLEKILSPLVYLLNKAGIICHNHPRHQKTSIQSLSFR